MKQTIDYLYVLGDGDKIRERIESHLLNNQLETLSNLSQLLTDSINSMKSLAISMMEAEVLMAGGDDILLRVECKNYKRTHIEQLAELFQQKTGSTFSFGVGSTVESAYLNLRRAKASGNGSIVE